MIIPVDNNNNILMNDPANKIKRSYVKRKELNPTFENTDTVDEGFKMQNLYHNINNYYLTDLLKSKN